MGEKNLFFNEKPVMALVVIERSRGEIYGSLISKKIDTTYPHTVKIIAKLEELGLVNSEKKGRKKIITLTDRGREFAEMFIKILEMSEDSEITSYQYN